MPNTDKGPPHREGLLMSSTETKVGRTKGPWVEFADGGKTVAIMPAGRDGDICVFADPLPSAEDARLIAAAPDHALICWAMCVGAGRWEPWGDGRGEFCVNGVRHVTRLDEFGCPVVTTAMRARIEKARTGSPSHGPAGEVV